MIDDDREVHDEEFDGAEEMTVVGLAQPTSDATGREAYLVVLAGNRVGEMIRVGDELVIGRSRTAGLRISDASVSKRHVRVVRDASGAVFAEDLQSRNGTYINGEPVERASLYDGDKIYVGSTTILKFSLADTLEETFQQQMYQAAVRDPLTGLHNRRHLMEQLGVEVSYAQRHSMSLGLVMLDIDHFKKINDMFGHVSGDEVLKELSRLMLQTVRQEDLAARYGGEEFTIVCRGTGVRQAFALADRFREVVATATLLSSNPDKSITVSVGVAGLPSPSIDDVESLINAADEALYAAKRSGRNRVCVYQDPLHRQR